MRRGAGESGLCRRHVPRGARGPVPIDDPAIAAPFRDLIQQPGCQVEVTANGFTAPFGPSGDSTGPWQIYRFVFDAAIAQGQEGAMRWRFTR